MRTWTFFVVLIVTALGGLSKANANDDRDHGHSTAGASPHRHVTPATVADAAYEAGYRNALFYWSEGVTVTDPVEISNTASVRAYRQEYHTEPGASAFIRGWTAGTMVMLQRQSH